MAANPPMSVQVLTKRRHSASEVVARDGTRQKACRLARRSVISQGWGTYKKSCMKSRTGIGPTVCVLAVSTIRLFLNLASSGSSPLVREKDRSSAIGALHGGRSTGGVWWSCMVEARWGERYDMEATQSLRPRQFISNSISRASTGTSIQVANKSERLD